MSVILECEAMKSVPNNSVSSILKVEESPTILLRRVVWNKYVYIQTNLFPKF
jgi:hypothetical protein